MKFIIDDAEEQKKYGPGDYRPNIPVEYWGFRWMITTTWMLVLFWVSSRVRS